MMISDKNSSIFAKDISLFARGVYDYSYNFTPSGSIFCSVSSSQFNQIFLEIPVSDFNYNMVSYLQQTDTDFVDFPAPATSSVASQSASSSVVNNTQTILALNSTISALNAQLSSSIEDSVLLSSAQASVLASKNIIINLRMQAGQGKSSLDFSNTFPYLPLNSSTTSSSV